MPSLSPASLGGRLLGYVEKTDSDFATTSTSMVDVPGASVLVTCRGRPIWIEAGALAVSHNGTSLVQWQIAEGATVIASAGTLVSPSANFQFPAYKKVRLAGARLPSVGDHTYKLQLTVTGFGTGQASMHRLPESPIWLAVWEEA